MLEFKSLRASPHHYILESSKLSLRSFM